MRCDLINSIKHQFFLLDDQPKRIPPVPSVILDDSVSVDLDPEVEEDERPTNYPAGDVEEETVVGWDVEVGDGEEGVRDEVADTLQQAQRRLREKEMRGKTVPREAVSADNGRLIWEGAGG